MTTEEIVREVGKPILKPLAIAQGLFLFTFISSPFIWIWSDFNLATKFGVTGLLGVILIYFIDKFTRKLITESVEKQFDDYLKKHSNSNIESAFQTKLEEMAKQREEAKSKNKIWKA